MVFVRTASTVFESVRELDVSQEQDIVRLLIAYEDQQVSGEKPDRALLEQAKALLEQKLTAHPLDEECVRLAQAIYTGLGNHQAEITTLRQFLALTPENNIRAWAWWHLVDCLALARYAEEVVTEQQAFLAWALTQFPAEECFFVIADGTQARSWLMVEAGHAWLSQCRQLFQQAPWTCENRLDRFYCLRTAGHMALELHRHEEIQQTFALLRNLLNEDVSWQEGWWISVEIGLLEIRFAQMQHAIPQMRSKAEDILKELLCWEQKHLSRGAGTEEEMQKYRSLAHNTAAPLYRARQYDLAIPLFQKAIEYKTIPYYAYLWLAAALWQTTHERDRVLPLLTQAAARYDATDDPWSAFQQLPEFQDVRKDAAFREAARGICKKKKAQLP